jgi:hypothetical protein
LHCHFKTFIGAKSLKVRNFLHILTIHLKAKKHYGQNLACQTSWLMCDKLHDCEEYRYMCLFNLQTVNFNSFKWSDTVLCFIHRWILGLMQLMTDWQNYFFTINYTNTVHWSLCKCVICKYKAGAHFGPCRLYWLLCLSSTDTLYTQLVRIYLTC